MKSLYLRSARSRAVIGLRLLVLLALGAGALSAAHAQTPSYARARGIIAAATPGSWVKLSVNTLPEVWTPEDLRPDDLWTLESVIDAWGSMAWDSSRGKLVFKGGGHLNYPGNEVYTWDMTSGLWARASLPSKLVPLSTFGTTGPYFEELMPIDGATKSAPNTCHEFATSTYLPTVDRVVYFCGGGRTNGVTNIFARPNGDVFYPGPFFWDPSKADPMKVGGTQGSHVTRMPQWSSPTAIAAGNMWQGRGLWESLPVGTGFAFLSTASAYRKEGVNDVLYTTAAVDNGSSNQYLYRYQIDSSNNPALDSWTKVGNYVIGAAEGEGGAFIHPGFNIFVRPSGPLSNFMYWKLDAASVSNPELNEDTPVSPSLAPGVSFANAFTSATFWDAQRDHAVVWQGGTSLFKLKPPASLSPDGWVLSSLPVVNPAMGPGASFNGNGVQNRLRHIAQLDAYVVVAEGSTGDVWAYKPLDWANAAPSVSFIAPASNATAYTDSTTSFAVAASDTDDGIARVDFYVDNVLVAQDSVSPYQTSVSNLSAGMHTLKVVAVDAIGAQTTITRELLVLPRDALVVQHEITPNATTGYWTPRVLCQDTAGVRSPSFSFGGTTDAKSFVFPNIALNARCIISLDTSTQPPNAFVFAAASQNVRRSASPTLSAIRSSALATTQFQASVGNPDGAVIQVNCKANGQSPISWSKGFTGTVVNGSISVGPVPVGASCTLPTGP